MRITSVCLKCGAIKKTGKLSCCARGGSWYGNCGATGNANRAHTWFQGMQACQAVMGQPKKDAGQKDDDSSNDARIVVNSKVVIVTAQLLATKPANVPMPGIKPITTYPNMSIETSSITSTRVSIDTSVLNADRTRMMHDTMTTTFKAIAAANSTIIHTSLNISTPMPTVPPTKPAFTFPNNNTHTKADRSVISTDVTSPQTLVSGSISAREYENVLIVIVHLGILPIILFG